MIEDRNKASRSKTWVRYPNLGPQRAPPLGALLFASLIGSFAWMATLSFWLLFWNCWPGHWWNGVQEWRRRCRLLRMLLMKGANQLPEVYDCRWRLSGVFFFWLALPQNEVVVAWHLIVCLLAVHRAVNDCFNLILFVASGFEFQLFFWLWQSFIHSPLPGDILLQQWHMEYIVYLLLRR